MNRCVLFADISNLYYCVGKRFEDRKLDYVKLLKVARNLGDVQRAFAYGAQQRDEASAFISCLKKIGFESKYKNAPSPMEGEKRSIRKADWEIGIAVDIFRHIERVDTVILCTANATFAPLVEWIKDKGVKIVVIGCGISRELKDTADQWIEIGEDLLEESSANAA